MKSEHTETIQKAFIMQSRHFETHKANFTQKGLFDHVVSEVQPKKTDHVLEVAVGTCICGRVFAPVCPRGHLFGCYTCNARCGENTGRKTGIQQYDVCDG